MICSRGGCAMSLKEVMDDYFNGVRKEHKIEVRNLIKHPVTIENAIKKAIGFPLINKMIIDYYRHRLK
jgi:predicted small metal-binding protein